MKKKKIYSKLDFTVVAPSRWIARQASESILFENKKVHYIPTGVNTAIFRPINKEIARMLLDLPEDKKIILYSGSASSNDKRKGYRIVEKVIPELAKVFVNDVMLLNIGSLESIKLGLPSKALGRLHDEMTLALVYSAADVLFFPSEADNLPNLIIESMSCGLPAVATDCGGIPELVNNQTGLVVKVDDIQGWVESLITLLTNKSRRELASQRCREYVLLNHDLDKVTKIWFQLFEKMKNHAYQ